MFIRDVMKGEVLSISPHETLADADLIFAQRGVKYLVVMQGNDVQGILSLTDLEGVSENARNYIKISSKMVSTSICISALSDLNNAEKRIRMSGLKALPVCQDDTLVGIVTLADIQEFFSRQR